VDLYIHSGDLLNTGTIPRESLDTLVRPFSRLTEAGIRVLIIPGNHERSTLPFDLFHGEPGVYVFDRPRSLCFETNGYSFGFAGFPFIREHSRRVFFHALEETGYRDLRSDLNILITHQTFDQAVVGPGGFVFRAERRDTVSREGVPADFAYIAAGHIHRHQILDHPLKPGLRFVYPGSTQRMSFAEMDEEKGFVVGELVHDRIETRFIPLPAYSMERVEIEGAGLSAADFEARIRDQFWRLDGDRVVRFEIVGGARAADYPDPDFRRLRAEMPPVLECQFAFRVGQRWVMR
jgi:DNA repair exonuclease SbcCD nuclease subunit